MKKVMITGGTLSVAAFLAGSFFKLMHWPGAAILLLLGIVTFCFLFLPIMLLLKIKEPGAAADKAIFSLGIVLGITYLLSMLFKVMHWPGATVMWYFTLSVTFLLFIPAYFFTGIRKAERRFNTMVTTILLVAFIGTQFMMTALRPAPERQAAIVDIQKVEMTQVVQP